MYAYNLRIDTNRKASDALATYARLEYGTSDPTWLLVGLRETRKSRFARLRRWATDIRKPRDAVIARDLAAGVTE